MDKHKHILCVAATQDNTNQLKTYKNTGKSKFMRRQRVCHTVVLLFEIKTFLFLRGVKVFQVLGAKPLLQGKVSEQLNVGLYNFPPALLFL